MRRRYEAGSPAAGGAVSCRWILLAAAVAGAACSRPSDAREPVPPVYGYEVVEVYPHDRAAFCQGLAIEDGVLYEGTGKYGQSSLRKVDLKTGNVLAIFRLNGQLFGEGVAISGDTVIQLTWRNRVGFVYDKQSLKHQQSFRYTGEGWGITYDGKRLIISDGSATLRLLDPKTFKVVKRITVRDRGRQVEHLNELEYVEGEIFANVLGSDYLVRIAPETGKVVGWIDLRGLLRAQERPDPEAVLNGIAYDPKTKRLFVTGKLWPKLFEIRLVPPR